MATYAYGKPALSRRTGKWWYWGEHRPGQPTPKIVEPFDTEAEAQKHADTHPHGRVLSRKINRK